MVLIKGDKYRTIDSYDEFQVRCANFKVDLLAAASRTAQTLRKKGSPTRELTHDPTEFDEDLHKALQESLLMSTDPPIGDSIMVQTPTDPSNDARGQIQGQNEMAQAQAQDEEADSPMLDLTGIPDDTSPSGSATTADIDQMSFGY